MGIFRGLFRREEVSAEDLGAFLRAAYDDSIITSTNNLREEVSSDAVFMRPAILPLEVAALLYFAFDFGMAAGPEKALRDRIRDGFLQARPMPEQLTDLLADRAEEYARALRSGEEAQRLFRLGSVFTKHTSSNEDISVTTWAAASFTSWSKLASDTVKKSLGRLY
jgi:hypothetical protein